MKVEWYNDTPKMYPERINWILSLASGTLRLSWYAGLGWLVQLRGTTLLKLDDSLSAEDVKALALEKLHRKFTLEDLDIIEGLGK